jgi:hypothetical protein
VSAKKSKEKHFTPEHKSEKKSTSKSKSMKKSKAETAERLHRRKNVYTGVVEKEGSFLERLTEESFEHLQKFKFNLLGYIFKHRLVRDEQYNGLYE